MKTKILIGLIFVFAFSITASAQIENEIKNYVDSTEILINNGRKLLSKSIQDGNLQKSKEVFHFLMMKGEERNCWSFSFKEQILLQAAYSDWNALLKLVGNYSDEVNNFMCYRNLESIDDALYAELRKNAPTVDSISTNATFKQEDVAVLKILSHILQNGSQNGEYDALVISFKKKYPESKYTNFVKKYLPAPKIKASIAYSFGPKFSSLSGNLKNYFTNPTSFGVSMDFCVSKVYISMYMEGNAQMKLLQPIKLTKKGGESYSFDIGDKFSRLDVGFKTGYYLIRNKHFHLAPYVTLLAGGFLESNLYEYENETNKEFSVYDSFTPGLGVNFEYKLGGYKNKTNATYMYGIENLGYFSLKMDAGFVTIPSFKYLLAKGDMSYVSLGLVWGIGEF